MAEKMKSQKRRASDKRKAAMTRSYDRAQARHEANRKANLEAHKANVEFVATHPVTVAFSNPDMGRYTIKHHANGSPIRMSKLARALRRAQARGVN